MTARNLPPQIRLNIMCRNTGYINLGKGHGRISQRFNITVSTTDAQLTRLKFQISFRSCTAAFRQTSFTPRDPRVFGPARHQCQIRRRLHCPLPPATTRAVLPNLRPALPAAASPRAPLRGGAVAARRHLIRQKRGEMITKRDGCGFGHWVLRNTL